MDEAGLGNKQSLFKSPQEREWIGNLYIEWQQYLEHGEQTPIKLADFYPLDPAKGNDYDLIVVDESQDFSHGQLKFISNLASQGQVVFCMDRRQNLADENPKLIYLEKVLTDKNNNKPSVVQLKSHYRCPNNIMKFAKVFNTLRLKAVKGNKSEPDVITNTLDEGIIEWLDPSKDESQIDKLRDFSEDANACVVTHPSLVEKAKAHLKLEQVFTPEQIKGLSFETIILYEPLKHRALQILNSHLKSPNRDAGKPSTVLSGCFVAATRASKQLLVVQSVTDQVDQLAMALQAELPSANDNDVEPSLVVNASSLEEWANRYVSLVDNGQLEQAKIILDNHFSTLREKSPEIIHSLKKKGHFIEDSQVSTMEDIQTEPTVKSTSETGSNTNQPNIQKSAADSKALPKHTRNSTSTSHQSIKQDHNRASSSSRKKAPNKGNNHKTNRKNSKPKKNDRLFFQALKDMSCRSGLTQYTNVDIPSATAVLEKIVKKDDLNQFKRFFELNELNPNICIGSKLSIFETACAGNAKRIIRYMLDQNFSLPFDLEAQSKGLLLCILYDVTEAALAIIKHPAFKSLRMHIVYGKLPLNQAIRKGNRLIVEALLEAGVDINQKDLDGKTALDYALGLENFWVIKRLLKVPGIKFDRNSPAFKSVLFSAMMYQSEDEFYELTRLIGVETDADFNEKNMIEELKDKKNPEKLAMVQSRINAHFKHGDTLTHIAIKDHDPKWVDSLLVLNPDLEVTNMYGETPLLSAARLGNTEACKLLLAAGADLNHVSPVTGACFADFLNLVDMEVVRLILEEEYPISEELATKMMLKLEIMCYGFDSNISLPFVKSVANSFDANVPAYTDAILKLIKLGANVNEVDIEGNTIAHRACLFRQPYLASQLVFHVPSIDYNHKNKNNQTVFICARSTQSNFLAKSILEKALAQKETKKEGGDGSEISHIKHGLYESHNKIIENLNECLESIQAFTSSANPLIDQTITMSDSSNNSSTPLPKRPQGNDNDNEDSSSSKELAYGLKNLRLGKRGAPR